MGNIRKTKDFHDSGPLSGSRPVSAGKAANQPVPGFIHSAGQKNKNMATMACEAPRRGPGPDIHSFSRLKNKNSPPIVPNSRNTISRIIHYSFGPKDFNVPACIVGHFTYLVPSILPPLLCSLYFASLTQGGGRSKKVDTPASSE